MKRTEVLRRAREYGRLWGVARAEGEQPYPAFLVMRGFLGIQAWRHPRLDDAVWREWADGVLEVSL